MSELDRGRVVRLLAGRGFNAEPDAVERLCRMPDLEAAIERTLEGVPADAVKITAADVPPLPGEDPPVSGGDPTDSPDSGASAAPETGGKRESDRVAVFGDVTGRSTGTGSYADFVSLFRDRYDQLASVLSGRVQGRSIRSLGEARGGTEVACVGMIDGIHTTRNGHWAIDLEDETGAVRVLALQDRDVSAPVEELVPDEVVGVEGTLADDGEVVFADSIVHPDIPRSRSPRTADRPVEAALVSDLHVGSEQFLTDTWAQFADWLHSPAAAAVEYLVIAGDMVEGVGVYVGQQEDLQVVDVYQQYERFSEILKAVPGDLEIIMIPGNHDAVRLAEPQPALTDEIAEILSAHDPELTANPSTVEIEGVQLLVYHGASLDELIAQLPDPVSYDAPHEAMTRLLRKRHLAPPYGGSVRIAPEESDYLVIDKVPDIFHAGHTHTFGVDSYRNVRVINTGCWQAQTAFQRRNNIDPDTGHAAIVSLDTLDVTVRKFT